MTKDNPRTIFVEIIVGINRLKTLYLRHSNPKIFIDMNRSAKICFVLSFVAFFLTGLNAQDYAIRLQVKTAKTSEDFPSLCSNKQWDGAKVIDLISTSNGAYFGIRSRIRMDGFYAA
jgi:hypothetical protein